MCLCSSIDNDEGKPSTYAGVCVSLVVVLWSYSFACSCKSHPLGRISVSIIDASFRSSATNMTGIGRESELKK